ncbi:asparaginase [Microlunatus sp. GCM10028923]|uniref:asparaginase n=1 Tax=Microlunatus sp. GCM10028923 TaxID=3273400 RepID=UPI003613AF6E
MTVVLISTGGTIASRSAPGGGHRPADDATQLLAGLQRPGFTVEQVSLLRASSFALGHAELRTVVAAVRDALENATVAGVVITHGTDTLEETAALLAVTHDDPRPVVLTGAQRAADDPAPDGPANLEAALALAADPGARERGVLVAMGGQVLPAWGLAKAHTTAPHAFASTFTAPRTAFAPPRLPPPDEAFDTVDVPMVSAHVGADGWLIDAAVERGAAGIVLIGTGLGNGNPALCAAVARAVGRDVPVGISSRVWRGPLKPVYGNGGGFDLVAAGGILLPGVPASQARVVIGLLLAGQRPQVRRDRLRDHAARWPVDP